MKISPQVSDNNEIEEIQSGPKFRNIHDDSGKDIIEEKPEGADSRLKISALIILILVIIMGVKGSISNSSLASQLEEQNIKLTEAKAEALLYGITEDEDGDLVLPESQEPVNVAELDWDSVEQRNTELLNSFTKVLLNWEGKSGYEQARHTLMSDWEFAEDSRLLTNFMRELTEKDLDENGNFNASMSIYGTPETYPLSNDGKNMSYFLICEVMNTVGDNSAIGTVGIRITINEDGTISNVTAQTLAQKRPKK